jgi:ATP-dependent helicase/nuclease subunit A
MTGRAGRAQAGDAAARERIRTSLHESLLVEASAGTGKTTELVRRILAVLEAGITTVGRIVAVTFTNKAAGELKLRLRQGLDRRRTEATGEAARNLEDALQHLEEASIGTIHAFCAQILRERPVEARVDPAFEEVAEQESDRLFNRAFQGWLERKLGEPAPGLRRALSRLAWGEWREGGSAIEQLKYAGRSLVEWRDHPAEWARLPFHREREIDTLVDLLFETASRVATTKQTRPLLELVEWVKRAEEVAARDYDTLESRLARLHRDLRRDKRKGLEQLQAAIDKFSIYAGADLAVELRSEMIDLVERYEQLKHQAGTLDFLDLLVLTRNLVRENTEVRGYLQNRFTHLFIDEFQDTDPVQAELLLLLSASDPRETDWLKVEPVPGKLFVVGDPKQSIYKFRRADVTLYQKLKDNLTERGVGFVQLTRSFRSVRPVQECVNAAFAPEMTGDRDAGQASYAPLEEHTPAAEGQPGVVVLPVPKPYSWRGVTKVAINESLPDAECAFVEWLVKESGWTVRDPEGGKRVPLAPRHICILFRRRTNFGTDLTREYTRSLEARGIPHLLAGSKSFHAREEVEALRAALTAVEWTGDELSVYATLRGPLFAIDDATLLQYRHRYGRLNPFRPGVEGGEEFRHLVEALSLLAEVHRERNWVPVVHTVNRLLDATRAYAGFALRPAGNQALANVFRMADMARSYEVEGGISFRGFVEMLEEKAERGDSAEAPVLEEGSEGVRLMTVHAAKGLEFPVVILADMTANIAAQQPDRFVDGENRLCAMKLLGCLPYELAANQAVERTREEAEGVRVAYVAATRARDLLVVPAVGDERVEGWLSPLNKAIYPARKQWRESSTAPGCPDFGQSTVLDRPADRLPEGEISVKPGLHRPEHGEHTVVWWDPGLLRLGVESNFGLQQKEILAEGSAASLNEYREWAARRERTLTAGSAPGVRVLLASEAADPPPEAVEVQYVALPRPEGRPRGPRFGSLVHAVLRDAGFAGEDVERFAELHGGLLGAPDEEREAARETVLALFGHDVMVRPRAATEVHRELPVRWREHEVSFEGVIDLAYRVDGAWTALDFKTDAGGTAAARYRVQLQWYAYALGKLTGEPVRAVLVAV